MAGASGAVTRAPRQPLHVTTWLAPRHPHASRPFPVGEMLADPPLKGAWFCPSPQLPQNRRSLPAACFPTHPHLSVALRRLGACGPGRGRARASLWGGLPRRVPPGAWSPMRPPRCGPGPARLPACGNHRSSSEGRTSRWKRRTQEEDSEGQEDWEDGMEGICTRTHSSHEHRPALAPLQNEMPRFGPHNSPLDGPVWRELAELWRGHHGSPPRDYVAHAASPTREQTIPGWRDVG